MGVCVVLCFWGCVDVVVVLFERDLWLTFTLISLLTFTSLLVTYLKV